jgi:hypothetical protein
MGPPDAGRPQLRTGAGQEQLADDHHDVEAEDTPGGYDCELLDLVDRLAGRVLDLEYRLAAAEVPPAPDALARQRRYTRARLDRVSPVAQYATSRGCP